MTIKMNLKGTVGSRSDVPGYLQKPGDAVLVERGYPRLLVMSCPCGCGEEIPINLDPKSAAAWELYRGPKGDSLYPSVWRETGCRSHFILWRSKVYLFGGWRDESDDDLPGDDSLREEVLRHLPYGTLISLEDLADEVAAVPWDVLATCRQLVKESLALEGRGKKRRYFGKTRAGD